MTWHPVAMMDDLEQEEATAVSVGDTLLALYKLDGKIFATSNVCTHQFALMTDGFVDEDCIECPLHQARFHIPSGERRSGPECANLPTFPVRIEDGRVFVHCE
jgi:3-phenylpropionate/trans-cinnamate dioxygenase ferredoxin subunit